MSFVLHDSLSTANPQQFFLIPHNIGEALNFFTLSYTSLNAMPVQGSISYWRVSNILNNKYTKNIKRTFVCIVRCFFSAIFHNSSRKRQPVGKK